MKSIITSLLKSNNMTNSEKEQLAFMPQSVKLEEAVNPHMIRVTMITISVIILIFFIWSAITKINEITRAQGEVVPSGYTQVVQHLEGALVKELLIRDGDIVDKNQILMILEDSGATQALAETKQKLRSIQLSIEINKALLEDRELSLVHIDNLKNKEIDFQNEVFNEKKISLSKEQDVLKDQIVQKKLEIEKIKDKLNHLNKSIQLTDEARTIQQSLLDKGYASRIAYIKYEQDHQKTASQLKEAQSQYKQSKSALSEYQERLASLHITRREALYSEINQLQFQSNQVEESLIKLEDRVNRLTIKSPVHGIVKGLQLNTVGGVVSPGKAILEVVPISEKLIVEAEISPKDVGHIKIGQPIRVKVSSFDFSRYGTVDGTLDYVSATTFLNEKKEPFYKVRIGLSKNYVGNNSNKNTILPGMTVIGDIITGEKTILSYLLKPIHLSFKTAFSER